jgi:hypothetical protein
VLRGQGKTECYNPAVMPFSGGSYDEVARWLKNFLTSHAKREDPRVEVFLDADDERQGRSYTLHLRFGSRQSPAWELDYKEVADNRGSLAWCRGLAGQARARARELLGPGPAGAR